MTTQAQGQPAKPKFLRNVWYAAAWSSEVGDTFLSRRLLGELVLITRNQDGSLSAMRDRCPHRFAPLSLGQRKGDNWQCPYHGLQFDNRGKCVHNPLGDTIPKGADIPTFPVVERHGMIWFWPGDPQLADPDQVPDFSIVWDHPNGHPITGLTPMGANFEYGTDNLLDLSHIEFVHKGSFAGRGVIFAGKHSLVEDGKYLRSNWWMPDVPAPSHTTGIYDPAMRTDHWLDMRWEAPATMLLEIGACPHGGERETGVVALQAHILTPETEDSAHYFWSSTRSRPGSPEVDAMLRGLLEQAFIEEDKPLIEAAYANLEGQNFWDAKPVFLGVDAGGTKARRILEKMIKEEQA